MRHIWDMINCSKFDCSKKLVDTILSTGRHHSSKCHFSCPLVESGKSFGINWIQPVSLLVKKINCSNCKWSTKVLENVNCSTQFIVKKMVYMYGSKVRGQVRLGQVRCTCMAVRLGARLGQVRLVQVRLGQVRLGQVRLGQVRLGVRLGRVVQVMNKYGR